MKSTLGKFGMMLSLLAVLFASIFVLSSCDCKHKKWSEWTVTEEETCGKAGQEKRNCLKCGAMQTREIGATFLHNFVTIPDVKATCTENGYTTYDVCYDCGFSMSEPTVIPATGHNIYTRPEEPASCTSEGRTEWASCTKCGIVTKEKEVIPKLAHTPEVVEGYPASCTTNGLTDGSKCSVCKTTLTERETIPAFGHTEVEVKGYAATCTESGLTDGTQCSVCSNWIVSQSVISPLQHDLIRVEGYAPTCENTGLSSYTYCNRCDYGSEPSVIPAYGHNETAKLGYPATCTEPGRKDGVKCTICRETLVEGEEIPAKGHNIVTLEGREPSCVVPGKTDGQMCNVCGEVLVAQEVIPKTEHNMVIDTERSYPPTCAKMGCDYYTCSYGCGTQDQQYIDELPHTEVIDPALEPTLSSTGLTEGKHCAVCEKILVVQIVLKKLAEFTVTAGANGSVSAESVIGSPGETVTITATPDEGYALLGWFYVGTDTKVGDDLTKDFNVWDPDGEYEKFNHIEARFYELEKITVNKNYSDPKIKGKIYSHRMNKYVSLDSVVGNIYYDIGDFVDLTAIVPEGYAFIGWYIDGNKIETDLEFSYTVKDGGITVEARFKKAFHFALTNENPEMGSVSWSSYNGECGESSVFEDSRITLVATKNPNYVFVGWYDADGNFISNASSHNVYMPSADYEIYAKFDYVYYEVKLGHNATNYIDEYATTSGAGKYHFGQTVNISVTYVPGVKFLGWYLDGEIVSENTEYSFAMPATSGTYIARFERLEYTLTVVPTYPELETITQTVMFGDYISESNHVNDANYKFLGWYINGERVKSYTTRMPAEDTTVEARYLKHHDLYASSNKSNCSVLVHNMDLYDKQHYFEGTNVRLTAECNGNYKFLGWVINGEIVSIESTYILVMPDNDLYITAIFGQKRNIIPTKNYADAPDPIVPGTAFEFENVSASAASNNTYKFVGWYIGDKLISRDAECIFEMPEGADITLEARYAKLYSVTADKNYADAPEISYPTSAFEGDSVAVTASSDKKYRFVGWYVDGKLVSGDAEYTFDMPSGNLDIRAEFEYIEYTVKTSANYGEITLDIPAESKYHFGDFVRVTAKSLTPTFKFLGWYQGDELVSSELEYSFEVTSNAELVAKYAKLYNVGTEINYENEVTISIPDTAYVGDEVTVCISNIAEGYRFDGWYIDGELVSGDAEYSFKMPEGDVEIVAKLSKLRAIEIEKNYADAPKPQAPENAYEGDKVTLIAVENELYKFVGWYIGGELAADTQSYSFEVPKADVSLEARFIKRYNITVNKNLPDSPDATYPNSQFEGERVTALAGESTKFYQFIGWYLDGELVTTEREYSFDMPSGDVTLEVRYVKLYKVETSIDRDGDLTDAIDTVYAPGETVTLNAHLLDGYRFIGWYSGDELVSDSLELVFSMPEKDISYTARYLKLYTVIVSANYSDITIGGSGKYVNGELVSLNAGSSVGRYVFNGWYINGELVSENSEYSFIVNGKNINIEARYTKRYQVSFVGDGVSTTGGGFYLENETVTVTAAANAGYRFLGWYIGGELVSTNSEYSFVMSNEDVEITVDVFVIWDGERADSFAGGSGTEEDPYLISHASELKYLAYLVNEVGTQNGYYKLISDIDLGGHEWEPIGVRYGGTSQNAFAGHFDGNGKSVVNFNITAVNYQTFYIGLFGGISGNIMNLNVSDFNIDLNVQTDKKYTIYVGGIVAYGERAGNLSNCHAKGTVNIDIIDASNSVIYVGLAVGSWSGSMVEYCSADGDVSVNFERSENNSSAYNSSLNVGGFAGSLLGTTVSCHPAGVHANANISIDTNESSAVTVNVGGLAASLQSAWKCYAEAQLSVTSLGTINVGGLASNTKYSINSSYSKGEIVIKSGAGNVKVGGIVARIGADARVNSCYSACNIFVEGATSSSVIVGGVAAEKEWSMYDGNNTPVPGCIAFGDITVVAKNCTVYSLFREFDKTPYGEYVYEGQKINVTATTYTIYQGTNVAKSSQANNQKFYTEKLNFYSSEWNFSELDVANGKYPELRGIEKYAVTITGDGAEFTGKGFYLEGETVTVTAKANTGYRFDGWYLDGVLVSTDAEYSFAMPSGDVTLVADMFEIWSGERSDSFAGGTGTLEDPYIISNASELKYLAYLVNSIGTQNGYYKLIADIDMGGHEWEPIGVKHRYSSFYYNSFRGVFDGDGHTVSNFKITVSNPTVKYVGLFGGVSGSIENLNVSDFEIALTSYSTGRMIGGIAGYVDGGKLSGCFVSGKIILSDTAEASNYSSSMYFGMIAGYLNDGEILKCKSSGELYVSVANGMMSSYIGGVLGGNYGELKYSGTDAYISVIATSEALSSYVGGVVGTNLVQGYVMNCYAEAEIECDFVGYSNVGGIAAISESEISDCFAGGKIGVKAGIIKTDDTGNYVSIVGGVVGDFTSTTRTVERCFSVAQLTVDGVRVDKNKSIGVGGIIGKAKIGRIDAINCVAANNITISGCYARVVRISYNPNNSYYYGNQQIIMSGGGTDGQYGSRIYLENLNDKALYQSLQFGDWDLSELDFEAGKYPTLIMPE